MNKAKKGNAIGASFTAKIATCAIVSEDPTFVLVEESKIFVKYGVAKSTDLYRSEHSLWKTKKPILPVQLWKRNLCSDLYSGGIREDGIFPAFQNFVERVLEPNDVDIWTLVKCDHKDGPHACFQQDWWPE